MEKINSKSIITLIISGLLILFFISELYGQEEKKPVKILSIEAYDFLNKDPDTFLVDVRTRAEYQFVGHPNNAYLFPYMFMTGKLVIIDGKYEYQFNQKNNAFIEEISKVFKKTDHLLILSRDGKRSAQAAKELVANGFKASDIEDGFEGKVFPHFEDTDFDKYYKQLARRNRINGFELRRHSGWQWWGLPWTYDLDPIYLYPPDLP